MTNNDKTDLANAANNKDHMGLEQSELFPPKDPDQGDVQVDKSGVSRMFVDKNWVRHYELPTETSIRAQHEKEGLKGDALEHRVMHDVSMEKVGLIERMRRRLFANSEDGLAFVTKPDQIDNIRSDYESAEAPEEKRVLGSLLAGGLFNQGAELYKGLASIQAHTPGVDISSTRKQCGELFSEALKLGQKHVHHRNQRPEQGMAEMWGEPLKAFSQPLEDFYQSRYQKIATAMDNIDDIVQAVRGLTGKTKGCQELGKIADNYGKAAKALMETSKEDPAHLGLLADFKISHSKMREYEPTLPPSFPKDAKLDMVEHHADHVQPVIREAARAIRYITEARVEMPSMTSVVKSNLQALEKSHLAGANRGNGR